MKLKQCWKSTKSVLAASSASLCTQTSAYPLCHSKQWSITCCCNPNTLTTTTTSQPIPRRPIWFGTDWLMYKITSLLLRSLLKIPQPLFISVELYTVFLSFTYDFQRFISWAVFFFEIFSLNIHFN